jgi:simple sugar transport system permease protein
MISIRLKRRLKTSHAAQLVVPFIAILLSLIVGAVFFAAYGRPPAQIYMSMLRGAFGNFYGISETIVKGIPLMLAALAASLAFKMKLWNIGAEGQIYLGAFAATGVALGLGNQPAWMVLPLMLGAGFLAGAVWAAIPGVLRARWQVNETISTLMLNYVGILWVDYLVFGPWKDPQGFNFPLSKIFSAHTYLPALGNTRVHLGIVIALIIAVLLWWLVNYTRWGYEIRVIGESTEAARYSGMNTVRNIVLVMLISGGIAGIAGMVEVAGVTHRLQQGLSPGYGYTGIIVAWLARLNPLAIIPVSILFGGLLVGGFSIQTTGVPFSAVQMLQGLILFFLLGGEIFLTHELKITRNSKQAKIKSGDRSMVE